MVQLNKFLIGNDWVPKKLGKFYFIFIFLNESLFILTLYIEPSQSCISAEG